VDERRSPPSWPKSCSIYITYVPDTAMTSPFRFELERVLQYRKQLEEQARMKLSAAQRKYRSQVRLLRSLEERAQVIDAEFRSAKSMTQGELWLWMRYQKRLVQERQAESTILQSLAEQLAEARKVALERAKERKVLEKLRMNRLLEHTTEEETKEQRQFDAMATIRFSRQDL
jgi:flagellar protein FliJ